LKEERTRVIVMAKKKSKKHKLLGKKHKKHPKHKR
jgi:hypothetical protein